MIWASSNTGYLVNTNQQIQNLIANHKKSKKTLNIINKRGRPKMTWAAYAFIMARLPSKKGHIVTVVVFFFSVFKFIIIFSF